MPNKITTLPKFKSIQEEAAFWDTHSLADYWNDMKPIEAIFKPSREKKETMTIRIQPKIKRRVQKIAHSYGMAPSTLTRMWIMDKLKQSGI